MSQASWLQQWKAHRFIESQRNGHWESYQLPGRLEKWAEEIGREQSPFPSFGTTWARLLRMPGHTCWETANAVTTIWGSRSHDCCVCCPDCSPLTVSPAQILPSLECSAIHISGGSQMLGHQNNGSDNHHKIGKCPLCLAPTREHDFGGGGGFVWDGRPTALLL